MPPKNKKPYTRRTPEQQIADLEAQIAGIKARAEVPQRILPRKRRSGWRYRPNIDEPDNT